MTAPTESLRQRPLTLDHLAILVRRNLRTSARVPRSIRRSSIARRSCLEESSLS